MTRARIGRTRGCRGGGTSGSPRDRLAGHRASEGTEADLETYKDTGGTVQSVFEECQRDAGENASLTSDCGVTVVCTGGSKSSRVGWIDKARGETGRGPTRRPRRRRKESDESAHRSCEHTVGPETRNGAFAFTCFADGPSPVANEEEEEEEDRDSPRVSGEGARETRRRSGPGQGDPIRSGSAVERSLAARR